MRADVAVRDLRALPPGGRRCSRSTAGDDDERVPDVERAAGRYDFA